VIAIQVNPEPVAAGLEVRLQKMLAELGRGMQRAMIALARYAGAQKLTGQVLHVRTGKLRRAVMGSASVETPGGTVTGTLGTDPSSWYGRVHEYGAHIPEVSGKLMAFSAPGKPGSGLLGRKGKPRDLVFTMRRRAFDLPARPWLRSSLDEQRAAIIAELQQAISRGLA
jgi:hypothetical protein